MSLEIRRRPDGTLKSRYWYGSFMVNGKRHVRSLGILIRGTPPASLRCQTDDVDFEVSRAEAKAALRQHVDKARSRRTSEALVQDLHEIKYGVKIGSFPVADLEKAWDMMPKRRRTLHPRYVTDVHATLQRFMDFVQEKHPEIEEAAQVTRQVARGFMQSETERKVSAKTWNDSLKRLRATFRFLQTEFGVLQNPFDGIQSHHVDHVHRMPFAEAELKKLLKTTQGDDFCRPLIICGLSTAMRLGDCCTLRWADVTISGRTPNVTVKTSKTGETVCIPIYEALMSELVRARSRRETVEAREESDPSDEERYVWPEQATMYQRNPSGVTWRLRKAFKDAGFTDSKVHAERQDGKRRASVRDFHSLRTTWITEALSRGVPIETVKLVSGHKTVEVVTTHYFRPGQDHLRTALASAIPKALTQGRSRMKPAQELAMLAQKLADGKATKEDKARIKKLAAKL